LLSKRSSIIRIERLNLAVLASLIVLFGTSSEPSRATADLIYYSQISNQVTIFAATSSGGPILVDLCRAHLWLVSLGRVKGHAREIPFSDRARCANQAATVEVEQQPARLTVSPLDPLRELGPLRLELRTDKGFVSTLNGAPVAVSGPRFSDSVLFYNPSVSANEPDHPFVDDASARLMKRYGHRPLWAYGDRLFSCAGRGGTVTVINHAPITLTNVERVPKAQIWLSLGTYNPHDCWGYCGGGAYSYVSRDPLRLTFAFARGSYRRTLRGAHAFPEVAGWTGQCQTSQAYVADPWDFERLFTTTDPRVRQRGWDPTLQQEMLDFRAAPGMTPKMVAFALGFPSRFGTAQELLSQTYWRWYPGNFDLRAIFYGGSLLRITPRNEFIFTATIARSSPQPAGSKVSTVYVRIGPPVSARQN
jgi:hypothetical protein